mmetsp:Transcript_16556/g.24870  ORF Transcript_16556/g.24870 Transcript_16556/m.24870 type:complete len:237 (+) Transcript_16556:45-755(+)
MVFLPSGVCLALPMVMSVMTANRAAHSGESIAWLSPPMLSDYIRSRIQHERLQAVRNDKISFLSDAVDGKPKHRGCLLDGVWEDRKGSIGLRLQRDALFIKLRGYGTAKVAVPAIDALDDAFLLANKGNVTALVDMRRATASAPKAMMRGVKFLREYGNSFDKIAIIGQGFSLQTVRFVLYLAPLNNVRIFKSKHDATTWLTTDTSFATDDTHSSSSTKRGRFSALRPPSALLSSS